MEAVKTTLVARLRRFYYTSGELKLKQKIGFGRKHHQNLPPRLGSPDSMGHLRSNTRKMQQWMVDFYIYTTGYLNALSPYTQRIKWIYIYSLYHLYLYLYVIYLYNANPMHARHTILIRMCAQLFVLASHIHWHIYPNKFRQVFQERCIQLWAMRLENPSKPTMTADSYGLWTRSCSDGWNEHCIQVYLGRTLMKYLL